MLEIINQAGITLQPDRETSIPVEVYNPIFIESNEMFQEIIYSAQAGLTEINIAFINSGHLVEADNEVYEQPVEVRYKGASFFSGNFRYKIVDDNISFELKVNFGAVAKKVKNTMVRNIITLDPFALPAGETAESIMKKTCVNPENYPFAFFPIKNPHWRDDSVNAITYPWMNYWDHAAQKFTIVSDGTRPVDTTLQVPFFKLSYVLPLIFEYLNFTLEGEILSTAEFKSIYIFNKHRAAFPILPSMNYLPADLSIGDFINQISIRMKLNFNYNLLTNTVTVASPVSALNVNEVEDISAYVERISELSTNDKKGYTVTLKIDTDDKALNTAPAGADEEIYKPISTLVVGSGETVIEMEVGTLKEFQETDYSYPVIDQLTNFVEGTADVNWPIRLLKFTGMKTVSGGKVFPQASAYDLGVNDATFYRFWNDCKKVVLMAKIPPNVLAGFNPTTKFGFTSKQGAFVRALNVKYAYNLTGSNTELVTVRIDCLTIVTDFKTPYSIQKVTQEDDTSNLTIKLKYKFCYADGSQPDESFTLVAVPLPGQVAEFGSLPARAPADASGVGGLAGSIYKISGDRVATTHFNMRIYEKVPQYFIVNGIKYFFTKEGDYYTAGERYPLDGKPMLIVF